MRFCVFCGRVRIPLLFAVLLFRIALGCGLAEPFEDPKRGIIVERVAKDSEAEHAGIQEGDIVSGWARGDSQGSIETPFDLSDIETEQAPRGAVTLQGSRNSQPQAWTLGQNAWNLTVRPELPDAIDAKYSEGQALIKAGKLAEAAICWDGAAASVRDPRAQWLVAWLHSMTAKMWSEARDAERADAEYGASIDAAKQTNPAIQFQLLHARASAFEQRGDLSSAKKYYEQELDALRKYGPDNLTAARALISLATVARHQNDLANADRLYRDALAIREKLVPQSLAVAGVLGNLGSLAFDRVDLDAAQSYQLQALSINQKLAPGTLLLALTITNLGNIARERGDFNEAEKYYRQALAIRQKLAPGQMEVASSLNYLGIVASARGDFSEAETLFREAASIKEKYAPGSTSLAATLGNLGSVAYSRGLFAVSENYNRRSLALYQKASPNSLAVASEFYALALIAHDRGDLENAEKYYQDALTLQLRLAPTSADAGRMLDAMGELALDRGDYQTAEADIRKALAIYEQISPAGLDVAIALVTLGGVADRQGDWKKARGLSEQSLAIAERAAPHSVATANALHCLGTLSRSHGNIDVAEAYFRRALAIETDLSPGSLTQADSLNALAGIMRDKQRTSEAEKLFQQSLSALENQVLGLGGAEDTNVAYRGNYANYYLDYINFLMTQKQYQQAFNIVERWKARALLKILAEGHINIRTGVDPELLDQERSLRAKLGFKTNQQIELLSGEHTEQQARAMQKEIEELLEKCREVEGLVLSSSPEYAALTQPRPLTVEEVQGLLDPDTLMLEYVLGAAHSYLWAVTSDSFNVYSLPKRAEIEPTVIELYNLLGTNNAAEDRKAKLTRVVSNMLLGPAAEQLDGKRLVIVPDGALQYLPFAPLLYPTSANGEFQQAAARMLILDHEIVNLPSASTLAVLRQAMGQRQPSPRSVAVFADPVFRSDDPRVYHKPRESGTEDGTERHSDQEDRINSEVERSGRELGVLALDRLPSSRKEADEILKFTHDGDALKALDFRASRAVAMSGELSAFRIVHFASHALLNVQHPDLSGIVLSLVDENGRPQDGFLRLQDIYNLKLNSDLVVLSACRTGLGKEIKGEGFLGLTRGFMYAGAPRVIASQWEVPDRATAELMAQFYRGMLVDKLRPAAALRAAQIAVSKEKAWADPYYWAAFILQGEWK